MGRLSVLLPEEIEQRLESEAELTGRSRSNLVGEAVGLYLTQKERDRLIEEMRKAARLLGSEPGAISESRELAAEGLDEWLEGIEREERAAGGNLDGKWWV
jgi:metal-responsive CopG/Arc/MetJ family transcriptional regulator